MGSHSTLYIHKRHTNTEAQGHSQIERKHAADTQGAGSVTSAAMVTQLCSACLKKMNVFQKVVKKFIRNQLK